MTAAFLAVLALVSGDPGPDWSNDILVWDMDNAAPWMGAGHLYCNALYTPDGTVVTSTVMGVSGGQGDILRIYSSLDNGASWAMEGFATGGDWNLFEPELIVSSGAPDYLLLFYAARQAGEKGFVVVARFSLPGFSLVDGYTVDYSNPQAGDQRSHTVARDPESGTIWHFTCDVSDQLFLSKSYDDGETWTSSELIESNVARPTATAGPGGRIFVAYQRSGSTRNIRCMTLTESGTYTTTIEPGATDAAPVPACEWTGSPIDLGVTYHRENGDVVMALSEDYGSSWSTPSVIDQGSYPFMDIYPGERKACLAYVNAAGTGIMVGRAWGLPGLSTVSAQLRTDQTPESDCPPVIRYSPVTTDAEVYGLFYMGDGPRDLWYDCPVLTGIEGGSPEQVTTPALWLEPNPFSGSTTVRITLDAPGPVELSVYSMDGRLVEHVYSGYTGDEAFQAGQSLPAGVYSVVMVTGSGTESVRMVKLD